ncbi:MAG: hypothetical protein KF804_09200 [Burkholderiales bacterium]|nr:hypothetical protein [Burkholderiales bacterium]
MKSNKNPNLLARLSQIRDDLYLVNQPDLKEETINGLSALITSLQDLHAGLTNPSFGGRTAETIQHLDHVITFLESASSDAVLRVLLSSGRKKGPRKAKREPIEIPPNLTNEQIRALLSKKLSRAELKALAMQRGISIGKSNSDTIKQDILKNLDRQEGYQRLATS